jgi:cytochrome d ubiquinol oxidase subunit I
METIYVKTGDEDYKRMAKFWGKLFLINFSLGVVTGITLEFQFGTNWSAYSKYVGDIFGSLLAIEATLAFYLESSFVGLWIFTWNRVSPKLHATFIWIVAIASSISALWILLANGWMQNPVGYVIRNGRAELQDFIAVLTNSFGLVEFIHTLGGAYILGGIFVLGVSSYHLLRNNEMVFFKKSFSIAAVWTLVFSLFVLINGHISGAEVARVQPTKLAAMESHWETQKNAPMYLFAIPDPENEKNSVELFPIPGFLSLLAFHTTDAEVKGLKDFPKDLRPPVTINFLSFRLMVGLGMFFVLISIISFAVRSNPEKYPLLLKILLFSIPLPYIAIEAGWVLAEVGRQPWIVYGLMKTKDAVSVLSMPQVTISLIAFILFYSVLGLIDFYLLIKFARKGPQH